MSNRPRRSNHLLRVVRLAIASATRALPAYSHPKSPQRFTQAQLLGCLVLKTYLKTTYRGVMEIIEVSSDLRRELGFRADIPHYSTLKYFADRLSESTCNCLLGEVVRSVGGTADREVAMDSTGFETTSASAYYQARSGKRKYHYIKCSVLVLCGSLMAFGLVVSWGPNNDKCQVNSLLRVGQQHPPPLAVYADAGYDAEDVHRLCWNEWGTSSFIPPVIHRSDGLVGGAWRQLMTNLPSAYGRRWHVESFMSGMKRMMLSSLRARSQSALFVEAALKVLTYTIHR